MSDNIKEIIGSIFSTAVKIVVGFIIVMFIRKYSVLAYNYGYRIFTEPPVTLTGDGTNITVTVGEDSSALDIGNNLESKGLIRDGKLFFIQELISGHHGEILPGKYELNTTMTADEMILVMAGIEQDEEEEDLLYNSDENVVPFDTGNEEETDEMLMEEIGTEEETESEGEGAQ